MTKKKMSIATILAAVFMMILMSGNVAAQQQNVEDLKDMTIRNSQGEEIGTVKEVITGPDGNIEAVVVQKGGFMGLGGEEERISWNDLQMGADQNYLVFSPGSQTGQQAAAQRYQTDQQDQAAMEQQRQQQAEGQEQQARMEQQRQQQDEGQQQARQQQSREGQESGDIVVKESAPQVKVDQTQPEVQVQQPSPKVSVQQPEPDVTVKQPAPDITVQVDQPKPEVDVQQQQPKVDVQQQKPEVSVSQPKPDVKVQQQEPEVTVEKSKPEVQVGKAGQPEVYIEKQQGQPKVEIERQGEPEVKVVRKEQEAGQGQLQQQRSLTKVEANRARAWVGKKITGKNGEELGTVESNYLSRDRNYVLYLIVQDDENKMHPIPAGMVKEVQGKDDLRAEFDKSAFDQSPSFSAAERPQLNEQKWSQEIRAFYGDKGQQQGDQTRQQSQQGQSRFQQEGQQGGQSGFQQEGQQGGQSGGFQQQRQGGQSE